MRSQVKRVAEHLEELRRRMMRAALAFVAGVIVGYLVARPILHWILLWVGMPHVVATSVTEGFYAILRIAVVVGFGLSLPVILYEAAAFVLPGLLPHERRVVLLALVPAVALFLGGLAASFLWVVPAMLRVMLRFMGDGVRPFISLGNLFSFIINFTVPFGVVAELPLASWVLAAIGVLEGRWMRRQRKYAVMAAMTLAAALAPPDAVSMLVMALPIYLLYEV
jgi:sec-independent protein translocase protein TatC